MDNLLKDNDREVENNTREQLEEPTIDKEDTNSEGETSEEQPGELKLPEDNSVVTDRRQTQTHYGLRDHVTLPKHYQ